MSVLPPAPRRLRARFTLATLGGAAAAFIVGALAVASPLLGVFDQLRLLRVLVVLLGVVVIRVGVLRVLSWRLARMGEETVVRGRPAIRLRRRVTIVAPDGYPLALTPDEQRRLALHKLVSDIHSC